VNGIHHPGGGFGPVHDLGCPSSDSQVRVPFHPAWSPDGKEIAFDAFADVGGPVGKQEQQRVFVMRADGSEVRQLTADPQRECEHPTYSPDGREIAFSCRSEAAPCAAGGNGVRRECVRRIFVLTLDDPKAKPVQITQHDGAKPVFAPVP
jgi:Tol biopolymer transport system component